MQYDSNCAKKYHMNLCCMIHENPLCKFGQCSCHQTSEYHIQPFFIVEGEDHYRWMGIKSSTYVDGFPPMHDTSKDIIP